MKHILLFNDKLHPGKDELLQTIVRGLQVHFVNCAITNDAEIKENHIYLKTSFTNRNLTAIFIKDSKSYDTVLKLAFKETINIQNRINLFETIHTPQLVFICDFAKDTIPLAHLEYFNIISLE